MPLSGPAPRRGRAEAGPGPEAPPAQRASLSADSAFSWFWCDGLVWLFFPDFVFFSSFFKYFPFFSLSEKYLRTLLKLKRALEISALALSSVSDCLFSCCHWVPREPEGKGLPELLRGETSDFFTRRARLTHLLSGAGAGGHWWSWLVWLRREINNLWNLIPRHWLQPVNDSAGDPLSSR